MKRVFKVMFGKLAPIILAGILGAFFASLTSPNQSAQASTTTGSPPWVYNMDIPNTQGMIIHGSNGGNTQAFLITDYLGAPIFTCNLAGGCSVLGDNFSTFGGGDIFNPTNVLLQNGGVQLGKNGPTLFGSVADPTGTCTSGTWTITKTSGKLFACVNSVWVRRA